MMGGLADLQDSFFLLFNYNSRLVFATAIFLGMACGAIGAYVVMRGHALITDAVSHAALPGLGIGFFVAAALGLSLRDPYILLSFAALSAIGGVAIVSWLQHRPLISDDSAIGAVLSLFFAVGLVFLSIIQYWPGGAQAGLTSFLLGQIAALTADTARLLMTISSIIMLLCLLCHRRWATLCFDPAFCYMMGWGIGRSDRLLLAALLIMVVAALPALGVILVIAVLIMPPLIMRRWCRHFGNLVVGSAITGGVGALIGCWFSLQFPNLPSGATIVLCLTMMLILSILIQGVYVMAARWWRASKPIDQESV